MNTLFHGHHSFASRFFAIFQFHFFLNECINSRLLWPEMTGVPVFLLNVWAIGFIIPKTVWKLDKGKAGERNKNIFR